MIPFVEGLGEERQQQALVEMAHEHRLAAHELDGLGLDDRRFLELREQRLDTTPSLCIGH